MSSARSVIRIANRMVPMIVIMGTIFMLSHQPSDDLPVPEIPYVDKVCHFLIYGFLALSVLYAFADLKNMGRGNLLYPAVLVFCLLFGLSDEYHQSFVAGRYSSGADLLADVAGAFVFLLVFGKRIIKGNLSVAGIKKS